MKVTCRYCESYVEVDETAVCPCCGAPLGEAVDAAKEQAAADTEKQAEQEAEAAAVQAKEQTKQTLITAVAGMLGGTLFGKRAGAGAPPPPDGRPMSRDTVLHEHGQRTMAGFGNRGPGRGGNHKQ